LKDGEDDWSTSDPGLISIVPNSVTSTNLSQDNFGTRFIFNNDQNHRE